MKTRMSRNNANGSLPCLFQATSSPSIEIGFFTETDRKLIEHSSESKTDFTTPEKGLSRYISKDLLKIFSSEDMLKLPNNYFHHHFLYNCKTCSFSSYNDSRRPRTLEKIDNEKLRNISTYGCPMLSSSKRNISKSQTEIIFKIPKRPQEDSLLDIKLVGTSLAINPRMICDECECICSSTDVKVERNQCNIPLGLRRIESLQKCVQNYQVVASSEDCCLCPEQSDSCPNTDTNKVSIKLGDNLFLSLVTDMDDQTESYACDECNVMTESGQNDKYPDIKILVKCNGETIREISAPPLAPKHKPDEGATSKQRGIQDDSEICSLLSCENRLRKDDQKPLDFHQTCCMAIDTTAINYVCTDTLKPKCSLSMQKEESDRSCTKCPLVTRVCGIPHRLCQDKPLPPFPQKKVTQPPKKISQPTGKKPSKPTPKKGIRAESNSSLKKKSLTGPEDKRKSSLCSCPPNKDDIASLGSFSLFFIINDMKTGDCACKKVSNSNELLQTAMICVHVDNSQDKGKCTQKKTSSCPALDSSVYRQRGSMTDRYGPAVCSCPSSAASKTSSCSCPSVRAATCPASYSQSTTKPTGYVCPFTKEAPKPKAPISQCVDTGMRSSMQKTPCSQPSQIRFSETTQAGKGKSCSAMACPDQLSATTQCQPSTSPKFAVQQTSVQVCPSKRSACIQPSRTCPPPQQLQTCVSQKSANSQPSTCVSGASQARQVLSNICPPSCKINLPKPCPFEKPPCTPAMRLGPAQPATCNMKTGPSFVCTAVKSVSCPSLKKNVCSGPDVKPPSCTPSVDRVNASTVTQSKSCSICINVSGPNDSRASLKKVCSFSGECKQDAKAATSKESIRRRLGAAKSLSSSSMVRGKLTPSSSKGCFSDRSGTSCSICRELSKLGECEDDVKLKKSSSKVKPRVIPAQKLKRGNNFNQLSHLDVSGADNFIFGESRKGDLQLITEDYSDLKKAFEKFMVSGNPQNPKCKYVKKG